MIDVRALQVRKGGKTICRVAELTAEAGARVAVVGTNGSGKSTLLRVLAGLEPGYEGRCEVAAARRERTFVHQQPYLLRGTVLFNVTYGLRARGVTRAAAAAAALDVLDRLGIRELATRSTRNLSGGETRRVAIARAVVLEPRLLLLDEPFADLDADGTASVVRLLEAQSGATIVIASPIGLPDALSAAELRLEPERARPSAPASGPAAGA